MILAYGLYLPVIRVLQLLGRWPRALSRAMERVAGRFGDYQPSEHDVLVCSYFKSGTNWTLQIAVQVAHRGHAQFEHVHDLVAWPEMPARMRFAVPVTDPGPREMSPTGLRVIKTHLPCSRVPYSQSARYICVVRDPKDVFASSYHFARDAMLGPEMPSVADWLDMYLSPDTLFGSWAEHVNGYWQIRDRPNVLFLTYEDMKADLPGAVRRIAQLMGVSLSAGEFDAVVRQSGFAHMKSIGHKFDPAGSGPPWASVQGSMIRRGERGGASEFLSNDEQRRVDAYWRAELARLNCDFPYDEAYGEAAASP